MKFLNRKPESKITVENLRTAYKAGLHRDALTAADRFLVLNPESIPALEVKGFSADRLSEWELALEAWDSLTRLQPDRIGPRRRKVTAMLALKRTQDAVALVDALVKEQPENLHNLALQWETFTTIGDSENAARSLIQIAPRLTSSEHSPIALQIGNRLAQKGQVLDAKTWFESAQKLDPDSHEPILRLARLTYNEGNLEHSRKLWSELANSQSDSVRSYEPEVFLARIAHKLDEQEISERHYRNAFELGSHQSVPFRALLDIYLKTHRIDMAESLIAEYENQPNNDKAEFHYKARVDAAKGDTVLAEQHFKAALHQQPDDPLVWQDYAQFLNNVRGARATAEFWAQQIRRHPKLIKPRIHHLRMKRQLNSNPSEMFQDYCAILDIDGSNEEALLRGGSLLAVLGRKDEAAAYFTRGVELYPHKVNFQTRYVASFMNADAITVAHQAAESAATHFNDSTTAGCLDLARIFESAQLPDRAESYCLKALDLEPGNIFALNSLASLMLSKGLYAKALEYAVASRAIDFHSEMAITVQAKACAARTLLPMTEWPEALFPNAAFEIANRTIPNPKPNNLAYLVTSSLGPGGAERQVSHTIRGLHEVDHEIGNVRLLVHSLESAHNRDFFLPDVKKIGCSILELEGENRHGLPRVFLASEQCSESDRSALRLIEALRDEIASIAAPLYVEFVRNKPSVVHLWQDSINVAGGLAARLAGVPKIILGTRSTRPDARRRARNWVRPAYQLLLQHPGVTMINNSSAGAKDYEDWLDLAVDSIKVVHNGLDQRTVSDASLNGDAESLRNSVGIPVSALVLGGVLRFSEEKRPDLWVEVAQLLAQENPDLHMLLIGQGPMLAGLKSRVADVGLGDRIHFPGAKKPVEPWIRSMDLLFLSSRMEGLPNVLLEAQCLGIPVISTNVGGAPETIVEGQTGFITKSQDAKDIANQISELFSDRTRLKRVGSAGPEHVQANFSIEAMIRRTLEVYRS